MLCMHTLLLRLSVWYRRTIVCARGASHRDCCSHTIPCRAVGADAAVTPPIRACAFVPWNANELMPLTDAAARCVLIIGMLSRGAIASLETPMVSATYGLTMRRFVSRALHLCASPVSA